MHICIRGRSIDLELKDVRGRPSQAQIKIIDNMNKWGCEAYLVYPKDWEDIKQRIEEVISETTN